MRMDLRGKSVSASLALILVVDVSGSMGGGPSTNQNHWTVPPTFASDLAPIEEAIGRVQPGGGTEIYPALKESIQAITPIRTPRVAEFAD